MITGQDQSCPPAIPLRRIGSDFCRRASQTTGTRNHERAASFEGQKAKIGTRSHSCSMDTACLNAYGSLFAICQRASKVRVCRSPGVLSSTFVVACRGACKGPMRDGPAEAERAQARRSLFEAAHNVGSSRPRHHLNGHPKRRASRRHNRGQMSIQPARDDVSTF